MKQYRKEAFSDSSDFKSGQHNRLVNNLLLPLFDKAPLYTKCQLKALLPKLRPDFSAKHAHQAQELVFISNHGSHRIETCNSSVQTWPHKCCGDDLREFSILLTITEPSMTYDLLPPKTRDGEHKSPLPTGCTEGTRPSLTPAECCAAGGQALLSSSSWPRHW